MTSLRSKALVLSFIALAVASQACTLASPTEVEMRPVSQDSNATDAKDEKSGAAASGSSSSGGSSSGQPACSAKFAKPDLASLKACGNDKGHCYAKEKMTPTMQALFAPDSCTGGEVCVDDEFIKAGGQKMTSCKGIGGEGVCSRFELNAPMVANPLSSALKSDTSNTCKDGLVCTPCVDIRDGSTTHMCDPMGLLDAACTGSAGGAGSSSSSGGTTTPPAPVEECCGGKGQCMVKAQMPNGAGDNMEQDSCKEANVCAPKALVKGEAKKCTTLLMAGICIGGCFNSMLEKASDFGLLRQGDCGEDESCVPCTAVKKFMAGDGTPVPGCE